MKFFLSFFRKLRPLDYLIILVVILSALILFKFFNRQEKWINVLVSSTNVPIYQANALHVGDIEKDSSGKEIARITAVQSSDAPLVLSSNTTNKNVFINTLILIGINPRSGEPEYKNKVIKIGSPIEFLFSSGYLKGIVASQGTLKSGQKETKLMTLKIYGQWPWFADSILIGEGEKDEKGGKIIEVASKNSEPAQIMTTDSSGIPHLQADPLRVDLTLKIKVLVTKLSDGTLVFRSATRLLIGDKFSFNAGETRIEDANIIDIQ